MRIVNPTFGQEVPNIEKISANSVNWKTDPIILFSNSKPNAKELLEGVRDRMADYRMIDNIDYTYKDSVAQGAPDAMYDELAKKYRAALLAIAD